MFKINIFQAKTYVTLTYVLQKSYLPQKKAKNIYNKDSARKNENLCIKEFFLSASLAF